MNCEHCQELLPVRERGELSSDLCGEVAAHVRTCAACAKIGTELHEINALLDTEISPTPGLRAHVLAQVQQEVDRRRAPARTFATLFARLWPSRPLGAFSYSCALLLCGMFGGQLLPGTGADLAEIPAERLYQLCAVPEPPPGAVIL